MYRFYGVACLVIPNVVDLGIGLARFSKVLSLKAKHVRHVAGHLGRRLNKEFDVLIDIQIEVEEPQEVIYLKLGELI